MTGNEAKTLVLLLLFLLMRVQGQYYDPYAANNNPFVYQQRWPNPQPYPQDFPNQSSDISNRNQPLAQDFSNTPGNGQSRNQPFAQDFSNQPVDFPNRNQPYAQDFLNQPSDIPNAVENFDYPVRPPQDESPSPTMYHYDVATTTLPDGKLTPLYGGIIDGPMTLEKSKSPYLAREDVIIGPAGVLDVEPGVEVRFAPMVGITIRGIINARGTPEQRITLTSADPGPAQTTEQQKPAIRLVDGPDPLTGRLQILHKGKWRSVCTNSKNWTLADMETACRQLGFQGGSWWGWVDRETGPLKPRLLLQEPRCVGSESHLFDCQWSSRQLGAGVCDYHPDLGLKCLPNHASLTTVNHWRGIRFEDALYEKRLQRGNTLFAPVSQSTLYYVDVHYGGAGRDYNTTSALESRGVPPVMLGLSIAYSAYNGINISHPHGPVLLTNSSIRFNRGYGIFVNSTHGDVALLDAVVAENGADGVRVVRANPRLDDQFDRSDVHDFCMFPTTMSQTYPINVLMEQGQYNPTPKECSKTFFTKYGQLLTVEVVAVQTDRNDSAVIEVYDGISETDRTLARFSIRNHTKLQAVTTTRNTLLVKFIAESKAQVMAFVRLTSGPMKKFDMNVTGSSIVNNNGRGLLLEGLRTSLHVHQTSIANNNHVAGIHVLRGSGDVNVTDSRIAFNDGDGLNVTYSGGSTNVTRSSFSSNAGCGVAVWINDTRDPEYINVHQEIDVVYSEIFKNGLEGILVGNFCGDAIVNITGNWFNDSLGNAVEVKSCWNRTNYITTLQIGHNVFVKNKKLGIKISPALNMRGRIEYNHIMEHSLGGIFIKNLPKYEEEFNFDVLPAYLTIQFNEMQYNRGVFVVNLGLSPYSDVQRILFTRNFVRYNKIMEPFDGGDGFAEEGKVRLVPRSRVAAPVVVSSSNVDIYRNIIQNHESRYEIGSHLEDQSKVINCTYNWLGYAEESKIYGRLFHRKDRYNLASIVYMPYLLHSSNPATTTIIFNPTYVPQFWTPGSKIVGGEVDGIENLRPGEYFVERDINVRPGGKLTLQNGVTLRFPPSVGLMVAGRLEARGVGPNNILLTIKEERIEAVEPVDSEMAVTEPAVIVENNVPVRLLGGRTKNEGRLQVRVNGTWGTVCSYGWTLKDAALVCQQLGLVLNPSDWELQRNEIPLAGTSEPVLLSNVRCNDDNYDLTQCSAETTQDFENTCTHEHDVGLRCHDPVWAGVRFGVLAEASTLQYVTVEKAGLLDYTTYAFKPAIQIDFARHSLENVRVVSNSHDGLGVIYSDLYSAGASNTIRNSEFSGNGGNGICFKQLGFTIIGSTIANNYHAGIRHNPAISKRDQQELAGWFIEKTDPLIYNPAFIPQSSDIVLDRDESRYVITQKVLMVDPIDRILTVQVKPGFVVGIQLLNPIHVRSTEKLIVFDSQSASATSEQWDLGRDLTNFPITSSSFTVTIKYNSGDNAIGGAVLLVSSVPAPVQYVPNRIVRGAIPSLSLVNTRIRDNRKGLWASYYNRYIDEYGDHYLRQANETVRMLNCDISHNKEEAIFVLSPYWNVHPSNISEITYYINSTLITDNGRGIHQYSRDLRQSNNLFHWFLHDNTVERNLAGGFEVALPYVWQYNENFTHTLRFVNNTFRGNQAFGFVVGGHYASLNMSNNVFQDNVCRIGLISFQGMEKQMRLRSNTILGNVGNYMVEFKADSQSEILGYVRATFRYNVVKQNRRQSILLSQELQQASRPLTCVVCFHGTQQVNVNYNIFGENDLDYELIAGVRTAKLGTSIDVSENWWGSSDIVIVKEKIFDFDDWNNHAIATFRPYLLEDNIDGTRSVSWETPSPALETALGGRIRDNMVLHARDRPYIVTRDITVMPDATLTIAPGVVLEFEPNVGILVLGVLKAMGKRGYEIIMRPSTHGRPLPAVESASLRPASLRLCTGGNCTWSAGDGGDAGGLSSNHGFLEYYNRTTMQWVPVCDDRFTERNAQVVCRELGYDVLNVRFDLGPRVEFHPNSLTRIWSYPEPLQCSGNEGRMEECPVRLNGQQFNHIHRCFWNSNFVYVHCGRRNLHRNFFYWGGVRFANGEFEQDMFEHRRHDLVTHETAKKVESILEYVNITGAGILHNEKSPAVLAVSRSPALTNLNISLSADDGISMISPSEHVRLLFNSYENNLGTGISIASLTGEGRESEESSFSPLRRVSLPYHVFSMVEMCDTTKEIIVEERVLLYFKYDNFPVNCVKIFRSVYGVKPFGFRLLQFNLFNTTGQHGWPDSISLYDGNIYNVSASLLATIDSESPLQRKLIRTTGPSLSVRLYAKGASAVHGFVAEVVTLPISAIGFNRDVQHNISYSVLSNNERGAVWYQSAGEVNPTLTVQWNQLTHNCKHLYGNFTTCEAAMLMDVQNTQNFYFRNNLVKKNQGGLMIKSDSRGLATALKGWIYNNLWSQNYNRATLHVEGRPGSAYQQITIYRNYFTRNYAPYRDTLVLRQVISNFTYNYIHDNRAAHILEVSGFEKVRLPYYQTTAHNGFYQNFALDRDNRGTIVAGTAGQHYVDNVLFNPDNDYEIVTVNRSSSLEVWKTPIDAKHNWWGFNESLAVSGRVKDRADHPDLLEVDFRPFLMNNRSILSGKCPPGWTQVGDTCYIYIGAPMSFHDAKLFCQEDNATMPYISGNYLELYHFLRSQQEHFLYYDRVWVQLIDRINQCTVFTYQRVDIDVCQRLNPFICEIDPKVLINFLNWREDVVTVAIMGVVGAAFLVIALIIGFWFTKSRKRKKQRLERRNSIRQSLRSLKSIGSTNGLSDIGYRRPMPVTVKPTTTVEDYNKMSGSLDSIEKSQYNSSLDDTQSYDIYEAHNPSLQPSFDLAYQNRGFRDTSTFASRENNADSVNYYDGNTLPMSHSTDSILDMKRGLDSSNSFRPSDYYTHTPTPSTPDPYFYNPPALQTYGDYNNSVLELSQAKTHSQVLLETNLDEGVTNTHLLPKSKSEAFLETNLDNDDLPEMGEALSLTNRSKSQPLETSM